MGCEINVMEEKIANKHALVIGDVMIDEYHYCRTERKTPEGPFLVWDLERLERRLGGAGNIAHNIRTLGARVTLAGVALNDEIERLAAENGIECFFARDGRETTIKRRFFDIETKALLAREDIESRKPLPKDAAEFLARQLKKNDYDVIVFSDYAKGVFNRETVDVLTNIKGRVRIADTKPQNAELFKGKVNVIKMNFREFKQFMERYGAVITNTDTDIITAGRLARESLKTDLLITRSEQGMTYIGREIHHMKAEAKEVVDIIGAGDIVSAVFAAALASGLSLPNALHVANVAASIKVTKHGSSLVNFDEIKSAILREEGKIVKDNVLKEIVARNRAAGKKIVFTNGCFDVLHHGHIHLLKRAKEFGDVLIVGLNSDDSVRRIKGTTRPRTPEHGRAEVLAALPFIDYIVIFNTDTPEYLIEIIKPDVYVKGKDYKIEKLPEAAVVARYGGRVELIELVTDGTKKISS
ncbi:MAG: D-glycero-beta-D-manno-heptose 1-phosphate adenylyltransferase, partial [Candidatus Bilamarchaeaceae archaeon]